MPSPDYARLEELACLIARHAPAAGEGATAIAPLFLSRRVTLSQPLHVAQWPCLALVAQGGKRIVVGQQSFDYGPGDFLLVSQEVPVISQTLLASEHAPLLGLGLAIDREALLALLAQPGVAQSLDSPPGGALALAVAVQQADAGLLEAVLRLLRLLDTPRDIAALAPLAGQEILYRLLAGPCGAQLRQIVLAGSPGQRIARAIAWLRAHYSAPLQIEALAQHAGMSVSSLHHHFKAATAMTPVQYQKQLRLHEARRLMLLGLLDVGKAGYQVGYQSASQFSREYVRLYGLPPQRDVERLRAQAGAGLQRY